MKKIIIGVIFLTVVLGGAAAGMMIAGYGPFAKKDENAEEVVAKIPPVEIDMGMMSIPLILENRPASQVQMRVRLVVDKSKETQVRSMLPKLQDAFLRDMLSFLPVNVQNKKTPDQGDVLNRLRMISERILGNGTLDGLVVTDIMIR